jgi:hypothetical protein
MAVALTCIFSNSFWSSYSAVLEEVNVRSNLALAQKRFLFELDGGDAELEDEYLKMSAQVVRTHT